MAARKKKELTPEEKLEQLQAKYIEERHDWESVYNFGCRDPFWPDGANLDLIRNHCIYYLRQMKELCKEHSLPMPETLPLPDKVDDDYMAPYGRFPNRMVIRENKPVQLSLEF